MAEYGVVSPSLGGGASAYVPPSPAYLVNNWFPAPGYNLSAGSALTTGSVRFLPFTISRAIVIDALAVNCTTAGQTGGVAQGSIHINGVAGSRNHPQGPALVGASFTIDSTGVKTATVSPTTLQPGLYWFGLEVDSAAGSTAVFGSGGNNSTTSYGGIVGDTGMAGLINALQLGHGSVFNRTFVSGSYVDLTGQIPSSAYVLVPLPFFKVNSVL